MTVAKKILSFLLLFLMVLPLLALPAGAQPARGSGYLTAFEDRSVLDDLIGGEIDGKSFSFDSYPYVQDSSTMQFLSFVEYGFSDLPAGSALHNDYSLFVYIYNPGDRLVSKYDTRHAITMKVGDRTEYTKYFMRLLSSEGTGDHHNLYLKFRVDVSADELRQMIGDAEKRDYSISEFEIVTEGDNNATAYEGGAWSFTGYSDGYGKPDSPRLSVVNCALKGTVVIRDIGQGVWRKAVDDTGWNYAQIDSVYFTIPHEITDRYGDTIVDILYEFYAYDSGWMVGFEHDKPYNLFSKYACEYLDEPLDDLPTLIATKIGVVTSEFTYNWVYNCTETSISALNYANMLTYVFKYAEGAQAGDIVDTDVRDYFSEQWESYKKGNDDTVFRYLGASSVCWEGYGPPTPYRKIHSSDLEYKFNTLDGNWLERLFGFSKQGNLSLEVAPIQIVDDDNVQDLEGKLYLDNRYKTDVKKMYKEAKSRGDNMYVFHFAASDYNSYQVYSCSNFWDGPKQWVFGSDEGGFVCREDIFMDFDMLQMTFERDGVQTVLPVQMSPINLIGELQLPDDYNPPEGIPKWVIIVIAIMLIVLSLAFLPVLLPILLPVLRWVLKALAWVVLLPFRLLWWLLKMIGKGITALSRRIRERIQDRKK